MFILLPFLLNSFVFLPCFQSFIFWSYNTTDSFSVKLITLLGYLQAWIGAAGICSTSSVRIHSFWLFVGNLFVFFLLELLIPVSSSVSLQFISSQFLLFSSCPAHSPVPCYHLAQVCSLESSTFVYKVFSYSIFLYFIPCFWFSSNSLAAIFCSYWTSLFLSLSFSCIPESNFHNHDIQYTLPVWTSLYLFQKWKHKNCYQIYSTLWNNYIL